MLLTEKMETNLVDPKSPEVMQKSLRTLLWFGIVSIIMLFAGLTSAYLVRQGEGKWVEFSLPRLFTLSTILIILSSVSMQWAVKAVAKNDIKNLKNGLILTTILGIGFVISQYMAWSQLYHNGIAFSGSIGDIKTTFNYIPSGKETLADVQDAGNVAGSFLYVLTALHVLHLAAGIISLLFVLSRALRNQYTVVNYNGVKLCAIYWHFLDGLWVYLFFFLLYIR